MRPWTVFVLAVAACRSPSDPVTVDALEGARVRVATFNVRRFFDTVCDSDARAQLEAVIRLIEAAPDQHRVSLVEPYQLLAEIESKRGDHVAAESHQREAIALQIELDGSDDVWVGYAYYKLALILKAAFDNTRALEACQRAIEIHRALSDDDSMRQDTEALLVELGQIAN